MRISLIFLSILKIIHGQQDISCAQCIEFLTESGENFGSDVGKCRELWQSHQLILGCKNATNWRTEKRRKFSNMTIDGDDINIQNLCMFVQGSSLKMRIHTVWRLMLVTSFIDC